MNENENLRTYVTEMKTYIDELKKENARLREIVDVAMEWGRSYPEMRGVYADELRRALGLTRKD